MNYFKTHHLAKAPSRGTEHAAGWDLSSVDSTIIQPGGEVVIDTGIAVAIPDGCFGQLSIRSGLGFKFGLATHLGIIDSDFRGSIKVKLYNHSAKPYTIESGDRVVQLIIQRYVRDEMTEGELDITERGENGYGSTGR